MDARGWIAEDEVDERISDDLFTEKYPPHLEGWYAASA